MNFHIIMLGAVLHAELSQILKATGKESFTLEEISNANTQAIMNLVEKMDNAKEESKVEESAEDLINKGLDKLNKK